LIEKIQIADNADSPTAEINKEHFIANAYPVLAKKASSNDEKDPYLEISTLKKVKSSKSARVDIIALSGTWWSGGVSSNVTGAADLVAAGIIASNDDDLIINGSVIENLSTSEQSLRSSGFRGVKIDSVTFSVTV
jgi:hypothetical protein